jgi:hypothetical protein
MNNLDLYVEKVNLNIQWMWNSQVKDIFQFSDKDIRKNKLTKKLVSDVLVITKDAIQKSKLEYPIVKNPPQQVNIDEITRLLLCFDNTFGQQDEPVKKVFILQDFIKSHIIQWHNPEYFWHYVHTMEPFPKWPILLPKLTNIEKKYPQREQAIHRAYKNRYSSN